MNTYNNLERRRLAAKLRADVAYATLESRDLLKKILKILIDLGDRLYETKY